MRWGGEREAPRSTRTIRSTAEGVVESLKMRRGKKKEEEASSHASQMKIGQIKEEREKNGGFFVMMITVCYQKQ